MRAGKLDREIVIQVLSTSVNPSGTPVQTWTMLATMRAQLVQQSTEEFIRGGAVAETAIIFRCRFIAGITTSHRVAYAGQAFNIKEVKEIGRREGLELRTVSVGEAAS
ncbi:MAG: phage head closure protein [Phreatobacter sp.]|nr:phage head closure protein [Phreatobacter sp.]